MKKRMTAVILAAVLAIAASFSAFAGVWDYTDGYWYFSDETVNDDDENLTGWQWIDGYCYYFDPDESGMMWISAVTPDGFPVNEFGRMTDAYGEPYYIPGWGLAATNIGPADYDYSNDAYYSDYQYPLYSIWGIDYLDDLWRGRNRDHDDHGRRTPDTVIIQVEINQAQPEDPELPEELPELPEELPELPEELPELPEDLPVLPEIPEEPVTGAEEQPQDPVINAGGGIKVPEAADEKPIKPEEPVTGAEDQPENQPENPVIKAGDSGKQSESANSGSGSTQTERPAARPQRTQESSSQSAGTQGSSSQSAAGTGRTRPANGNPAGSRGGSGNSDMDLWFLLGLEEEQKN